jgi:hypothetical protein
MGNGNRQRPRVVVVGGGFAGLSAVRKHARTVSTRADAIEVRDVVLGNLEADAQGRPQGRGAGDRHRGGRGRPGSRRPAPWPSGASGARS